jgi:hypothetical protein
MPLHDWTRVEAGVFHDFHATWIPEIKKRLNSCWWTCFLPAPTIRAECTA